MLVYVIILMVLTKLFSNLAKCFEILAKLFFPCIFLFTKSVCSSHAPEQPRSDIQSLQIYLYLLFR